MSTIRFSDTCAGGTGVDIGSRTPDTVGVSYTIGDPTNGTFKGSPGAAEQQLYRVTSGHDGYVTLNPTGTLSADHRLATSFIYFAGMHIILQLRSGYNLLFDSDGQYITLQDGITSATLIAPISVTWALGDYHSVELACIGNTHTIKMDGTTIGSVTDTAHPAVTPALVYAWQNTASTGAMNVYFKNVLLTDEGSSGTAHFRSYYARR